MARAAVAVSVDASADNHPIPATIYGANFPSDAELDAGRLTVGRWGGNSTTRYNYTLDLSNTAADYFFENVAGCWNQAEGWCASPPADPKESSKANLFLSRMKAKGAIALITVPTIGFVAHAPPKYSHPLDCGCSKSQWPAQNSFDPYDPNCGDGLDPNTKQPIDCGVASNTSVAVDPAWVKGWATYLVQKFGPSKGQRIYALDNEPALWSQTHRDLRKTRLGYDELWQRMRDYAEAILEADPTAEISGPAEWGFPNYFCSDADDVGKGCSPSSPDRAAHGGLELVAWLLSQAKAYEQVHGKRILHYLDLHYYPQGGSLPDTTRSLWDPNYKDPSWVNDVVRLLPRMRDWTNQYYSGTKIAVSEYDFYSHDVPMGAVGYAEVLGLFAREGVDLATAWAPPNVGQPAFTAYELYRNYDGMGSGFESTSVRASVSGAAVQAYAATGANRLTVALVNEGAAEAAVDVSFSSFTAMGPAELWVSPGGKAIVKQADVDTAGGKASVILPATSIAMLVVKGMNPNGVPDAGVSQDGGLGTAGASSTSSGVGGEGAMSGGRGGASNSGSSIPSSSGCGIGAARSSGASAFALLSLAGCWLVSRRRRIGITGTSS
jgi:hypothetical protein